MHELLTYAPVVLSAAAVLLLGIVLIRMSRNALLMSARLDAFERSLEMTRRLLREEIALGRDESARMLAEQRRETAGHVREMGSVLLQRTSDAHCAQGRQFDALTAQFSDFSRSSLEQLANLEQRSAGNAKALREEVVATLTRISETMARTMGDIGAAQKSQLDAMAAAMAQLTESNAAQLETVRGTVEEKLHALQADNARQLDSMRRTVDEKLQGTLEKRLGESFRQVSERLEQVHKGLGEMQTLATGVGDLKKVLTNVKTRGTWGEVQLGALLEQVLSAEQYVRNAAVRDGAERVEFAVKLPGPGDEAPVLLPIDAKFPLEDYQRLLDAQERADAEGIEQAGRQLEARVRVCARDIRDKYVNPPVSTDFGILFLPVEGLFAEIIRRPGLTEAIQRDCRVVVAGPTTLWSILNSLQMGFRTLAIQKRSGEVWTLLGAVKTEWTKYGEVLDAVQKRIHQASETIEKAKVRTRAIGRRLSGVQELPAETSSAILSLPMEAEDVEQVAALR